jgi:dihydropteroate synthase
LPFIMGVINVTPDSFSDGGRYYRAPDAVAHARRLIDEGADVLDIGGESTRPGSDPVSPEEQIRRIGSVIRQVRSFWNGPISIDTTRSQVADAAIAAGADWINDISAMRDDPAMAEVARRNSCTVVLMHSQGRPKTMQAAPRYDDAVVEVAEFLSSRAELAIAAGIPAERIILDPGIGFGKSYDHNLALMTHLDVICSLGYPVLIGVSRKSFIGQITGAELPDRLEGSLVAVVAAARLGASIVRVHDVAATKRALQTAGALGLLSQPGSGPSSPQ